MASQTPNQNNLSPNNAQNSLTRGFVNNINSGGYRAPMSPNNQPQQIPQANLLAPQNSSRAGKGPQSSQPQNFTRISPPTMKF